MKKNISEYKGWEHFIILCDFQNRIDSGTTTNINLARIYKYIESIYDNIFDLAEVICEYTINIQERDINKLLNIIAIIEDYAANDDFGIGRKYNYIEVLYAFAPAIYNIATISNNRSDINRCLRILKRWNNKYSIGDEFSVTYGIVLALILRKFDKMETVNIYAGDYTKNKQQKEDILKIIEGVSKDILDLLTGLITNNKAFIIVSNMLEYLSCKICNKEEYDYTGRWVDCRELNKYYLVNSDVFFKSNNDKLSIKLDIDESLTVNNVICSYYLYDGGDHAIVLLDNMSIYIISNIDVNYREELKNRKIIDVYKVDNVKSVLSLQALETRCINNIINMLLN